MVVPVVVLVICGVVVLVGSAAELFDTVRAHRVPAAVPAAGAGPDASRGGVAAVGRWPLLAWLGLAGAAVLAAASVADRMPDVDDLALSALLLGFAGERAFYLLRRHDAADGAVLGAELLALVVGATGLLVGFTL